MSLRDFSFGIRARVIFLALVPVLLVSAVLGVYTINTRVKAERDALRDRGATDDATIERPRDPTMCECVS